MLSFDDVKEVRLTNVLGRYGVSLRFKGEWGCCVCPLPTHRQSDKGRNFTVNVKENYWRCFSDSCNANNGGKKGGDVINFVAAKEGISQHDAAKKIADWFGIRENKTGPHMESRDRREAVQAHSAKDSPDHNPPRDNGKGYIQAVDGWFDEVFELTEETKAFEFWKKARNAVKGKLIESFKNGRAAMH